MHIDRLMSSCPCGNQFQPDSAKCDCVRFSPDVVTDLIPGYAGVGGGLWVDEREG